MPLPLRTWLSRGVLTAGLLLALPAAPVRAQSDEVDGVTGRLIELLVKRGVLHRDEANALLAEAKAEKARPAKAAAKPATTVAAGTKVKPAAEEAVPPGTVRVTYVPQIVRDQIAQQVRADMMQAAANGEPVPPGPRSAFLDRFHFFGDMRFRSEWDLLPKSNAPQFVDFGAINNGAPYDITGASGPPPLLDSTQNRYRERLRARAGVDVQIDDGLMGQIEVATGNDASPVTANQTLGQNGTFTKYAIWLDRAFVKATPTDWVTAYVGRMPNPFWTTDLNYYDDLGFDGVAVSATYKYNKRLGGFLTAGAFPVFNTAFNFGSTSADSAYASRDAWLFGFQGGGDWQAAKDVSTRLAAAYFDYSNVNGKVSSPCTIVYASDTCSTDNTRTLYPSNGNTMIPLRNLVLATPTSPQPQYFGLASPFHVFDLHGRVNLDYFKPVDIMLESEFAINLGFDRNRAISLGVNNFGSSGQPDPGNKAWMIKVAIGHPTITQRWDWNAWVAYKYVESDSVLASLTDPDFHLGGTNAKGFILAANLGLARNTWLTAKWLNAVQVSGQPYTVDVIQADLSVKF